ncbi:hypothetical protein CDD81_2682 [Ophiocordyceps australis]|uniref:Uncharacterized protein n=1 Tax=Ophiocordyceps australis TaxID=1399860 RepID=A0A2C5XX38_9HYPO|nr:hypothetical protein CDD81_2682 [Ophiocordyceps australis]
MKVSIAALGMLATVASASASYHHRRLHFPRNNGTESVTTAAPAPLSTGSPDVITTDITTDMLVTQVMTSGSETMTTTKTVHTTIRSTIKLNLSLPTEAPDAAKPVNNQEGGDLTTMTKTKTTTNTRTLRIAGAPTDSPAGSNGKEGCPAASTVYVTMPASTVYVTPSQVAPSSIQTPVVPYPTNNSTGISGAASSSGFAAPSGFARLRR